MDNTEFKNRQQRAVEQMRQMNARSTNPKQNTSAPPPPKPSKPQQKPMSDNLLGGFNLPFTDLLKDSDTTLILGLLLILFSENADKRLLFALVYILL